jgi:predicted CoA-substrate-specific enzyme activase
MFTVGIDIGLENTKAVVMKDGAVVGRACGPSGGADRPASVRSIYESALSAAGIGSADVKKAVATGKGKFDATFADDILSEAITTAKAGGYFEPKATMVVDIGADEIVALTLAEDRITEFVINQKCAAGLGLLLESMAERFELGVEELGALEGPAGAPVNDGCVVFAELDALSLVNRGADVKDVAKALIDACASRANSTLNDIYKPDTGCVVLLGGLAMNGAFVKALERISGIRFVIPDDAYYGGAIGAAVSAAA